LVVSESARSLSSAVLHQALLHDLFIQTIHPLDAGRTAVSLMAGRGPDRDIKPPMENTTETRSIPMGWKLTPLLPLAAVVVQLDIA
jgi:hypothetical protein